MQDFLFSPNFRPIPRTWSMGKRDGAQIPMIVCNCGESGALDNHEVDEAGLVTPSFFHDEKSGGCGFHDGIILIGYSEHGPNAPGI